MASTAILAIKIISDARDASKGLDAADKATGRWSSGAQKAGKVAGGILAAGVGAAAVAIGKGTQSAIEDAAAQARLAKALENSAGATSTQVKAVEDWISKTALATGVADDDLRPAFEKLVGATGDVGKAQSLMTTAMDTAAARGISLEQVTKALEKAQNGQVSGLSRLGISTEDAAGKMIGMDEAVKRLNETYGGQAAVAADTLAGKQARLKVAYDEIMETIGAKLLPVLTTLAEKVMVLVTWISENLRVVGILAGVLGGFLATVWAVGAATKAWATIQAVVKGATVAWTVAQKALNLVLRANPIGLVITAIGLLVAGLILAYNKSETFRNIVNGVMGAVRGAIQKVVDIIGNLIGWVRDKAPAAFQTMKQIGVDVWNVVTAPSRKALEIIMDIVGWIKDKLVGGFKVMKETAVNAFNAIIDPIKKAISWVQDLINKISNIDIPSFGDIGGSIFGGGGLGSIFGFSAPAPAPSLFGARGLTGATALAGSTGGGAYGSRGGQAPVQIIVQGALDPDAVARQIETILGRRARRIGASA